MNNSSLKHLGLLSLVALGSNACMMSPYHGKVINSKTTPVVFEFYATEPGVQITVDCGQGYYDPFVAAPTLTFTSVSTPTTLNGETVYYAGGSKVLPNICWSTYTIHGYYMTRLRPKQAGNSMRVYDQDGLDCVGDHLRDGEGPVTAGNECGMKYSNSNNYVNFIHLHANP
jgi:hypothetical protein